MKLRDAREYGSKNIKALRHLTYTMYQFHFRPLEVYRIISFQIAFYSSKRIWGEKGISYRKRNNSLVQVDLYFEKNLPVYGVLHPVRTGAHL